MKVEAAKMEENVGSWPDVSVFVAARNEAVNLPFCLSALAMQDYPGSWEVWIGDDHSTDGTGELAESLSRLNPRFQALKIPDPEGKVQGKAWVLACLAERANGAVFLFCDADMQMPSGWISAMVDGLLTEAVDLVNGTTATAGDSAFSALQAIDWLIPQGTFAWLSRRNITYTAMGNNMAITRKAYEATGGFLRLPFSLTEDFELFRAARSKGFRLRHLFKSGVLGITAPQKSVAEWQEQHIRWMVGFQQLPFRQRLVFYLQILFYPLLVCSVMLDLPFFSWALLSVWGLKIGYQAYLLWGLRQEHLLLWLVPYEILFWPAYLSCWIGYLTRGRVVWKNRIWRLS